MKRITIPTTLPATIAKSAIGQLAATNAIARTEDRLRRIAMDQLDIETSDPQRQFRLSPEQLRVTSTVHLLDRTDRLHLQHLAEAHQAGNDERLLEAARALAQHLTGGTTPGEA